MVLLFFVLYLISFSSKTITSLAININNVSLCDFIRPLPLAEMDGQSRSDVIDACYSAYAEQHAQENACSQMLKDSMTQHPFSGDTNIKYISCVWAQAKGSLDPKTCFQITDSMSQAEGGAGKSYCVAIVASLKKDKNICMTLPQSIDQERCVKQMSE
jgi:hypothetical protein